VQFKWTYVEKEAFDKVKAFHSSSPYIAKSIDFSKDFLLYTFSSDHSLATMLTQKDEKGNEHPISFMSTSLQGG
jgi:hypothetical protein